MAGAVGMYFLDRRIRGLEHQRNVMLLALAELGYGTYSGVRAKTLKHLKRRYWLSADETDDDALISVLVTVGPDSFCRACGAVCATDSLACGRPLCLEYVRVNEPRPHERLRYKSSDPEG